ncbi:MAG: VanZ family protein [Acetivibrio ethanolgignens]
MKNKREWIWRISWIAFIIYLAGMAYFLFFSEGLHRSGSGEYRYNLVLFQEIKRALYCLENGNISYFLLNVVMNVAAFAPFGFFLPVISPKNKKFLNVFLLSLELTLTIEILQLLFRVGIFDVDDIAMNTLGGILGYGIYYIGKRMERKRGHGR